VPLRQASPLSEQAGEEPFMVDIFVDIFIKVAVRAEFGAIRPMNIDIG